MPRVAQLHGLLDTGEHDGAGHIDPTAQHRDKATLRITNRYGDRDGRFAGARIVERARDVTFPGLNHLRDKGILRIIGASLQSFGRLTEHKMPLRVKKDDAERETA